MPVDSQFPAQLIVMVSAERKASYSAEAQLRRVSIGQVVRERLDLADERIRLGDAVGANGPLAQSHQRFVEPTASERAELHAQLASRSAFRPSVVDQVADDNEYAGLSLAEVAASLPPDRDADDTDEHLASLVGGGDPLARLQARGLL